MSRSQPIAPSSTAKACGVIRVDGTWRTSRGFFMAPGMYHCGGGVGPNTFDALTALERWVESGEAPSSIVASHTVGPGANRTLLSVRFRSMRSTRERSASMMPRTSFARDRRSAPLGEPDRAVGCESLLSFVHLPHEPDIPHTSGIDHQRRRTGGAVLEPERHAAEPERAPLGGL
jgi:tannase/feruloyl esterase